MKFFQNLFAKKENTLHDPDLGTFKHFSIRNKPFYWTTTFIFLDKKVELSLSGNAMNLNVEAKKWAMLISRHPMLYSEACDKELKELFGNADIPFSTWSDSLDCNRITINKSTVKICFVDSDFYYFNILFENGQLTGHSIDH